MKPIIVCYYTLSTPYEQESLGMEISAREFGLCTDVRGVPNLGDWTLNCGQKPAFIRDRMLDYEGRPVVWIDADARVRAPPVLFEHLPDVDFAAHWRNGTELLSGTIYFGPTPRAWALVQAWCESQQHTPDVWDQRTLQRVIESDAIKGLVTYNLPPEYTRVFDDATMGEPVIEHTQASRRLRNTVYC